jgi:hypothetical protein
LFEFTQVAAPAIAFILHFSFFIFNWHYFPNALVRVCTHQQRDPGSSCLIFLGTHPRNRLHSSFFIFHSSFLIGIISLLCRLNQQTTVPCKLRQKK